MSIATDEAEKYFPTQYWPGMEPNGDYRGRECHIEGVKSSDIQEAYERGRTAEPTEAEIEAAAHRLYEITHAPEADPGWYAISEEQRNTYRKWSEPMLTAARKAVTSDE